MSPNVLVGACIGIAVVLPVLLGLRGYVARAVVWLGTPVLTIVIGLALRITPVDNPVAVLFLFGGIALLLIIVGLAGQARARGQFSSGNATNLPRTSSDTPQPNPTQEEGPAYLRPKESVKPEKEEAGEETGRQDSGSGASATTPQKNLSTFMRSLVRLALPVGVFLFFGMSFFGTAWESVKMLWLQAPWVAIPMLATPRFDVLPFVTAVIYSAPFFALGYILTRFSRRAAHTAWLPVAVLFYIYGSASWIAGLVGFFRSP